MFEVPESDITCVRVDKDVISENKPVEYIRAIKSSENSETTTVNIDTEQQEPVDKAKTYA
jgi:hypothetical protein